MTVAPRLPYILAWLRRLLLQALKQGASSVSSALTRILRKFGFIWANSRSRSVPKKLGGEDDESSSGRTSRVPAHTDKALAPRPFESECSRERAASQEVDCQYTLNPNGESVSLDHVAFSLYPFAGGLHNASRSSQNLAASRNAHTQAIASRSRSPSPYGSSTFANSNEGNDFTIVVRSPTSPPPRRQLSHSLPELPHHANESVHQLEHLPSLRPYGDTTPDVPYVLATSPLTSVDTSQREPTSWTEQNGYNSPRDIDEVSIQVPAVNPSASSIPICLNNERITPVMPEASQRYTRRPRIPKQYTAMTIQPLTFEFEKPIPPNGWSKIVHPEGARYFFNSHERVYTDADIFDPTIFQVATEVIKVLKDYVSENRITLPAGVDLVIDVFYDEMKTIQATYYYIYHSRRIIFFLDTYDATLLPSWYEIQNIRTESHLGHEIEAQYWFFIQLFPSALPMSHALASELRDTIFHFIGDSMTSHTTTAPYTLENLFKILPLTSSAEGNIDRHCLGTVSFISRQMYIFARSRFLNFSGEAHARLERNFSVHGVSVYQRTLLVKTLSLFLFLAPDFHLRNLQDMWVDGIMNQNVWKDSVKKMTDEWQEFVLFGTVMLNANVAFLAIQSVDTNRDPYRSPAQISSYFSVVASIGSIVLGLLLIRQNRTKSRESVEEVQAFLGRMSHPRLGLETLAILHSLPYALLMWGMVAFMAAFAFECFEGSNIQTRTLLGSFSVAITGLILWAVYTSWEKHKKDAATPPIEPDSPMNDEAVSFCKSQKSTDSEGGLKATRLSKFLALPILWLRQSTLDSARTIKQPEHV